MNSGITTAHILLLAVVTSLAAVRGAVVTGPVLACYGMPPGTEFQPTEVAPGVAATPLTAAGSRATLEPGERLPGTVFLDVEVLSTGPSEAVANDQYFQFTLSPLGGQPLTLQSLSFDAARGGFSTPRGWVLRSSLDGFSTELASALVPTEQPALTNFSVPFSSDFGSLPAPTTFRLYGFAPSSPGVGLYFDNLAVSGFVVPEPSALALLALAIAPALGRRVRNR